MKKICFFLFLCCPISVMAQTEKKLSKKESKKIMDAVMSNMDALKDPANNACECIEKININEASAEEIRDSIISCIDKEVISYGMIKQMNAVLVSSKNTHTVILDSNKNSKFYKENYREIEERLLDSCDELRSKIAVNNKLNNKSMSQNVIALDLYKLGSADFEAGNIKDALDFFERAVAIDDQFAFAWDNIGICYRKLEKYDEAIKAYQKSIAVDSNGETPLRNIAVVYSYRKDFKNCEAAYKVYIKKFPNDAEGFFGLGREQLMQENFEEGLENMCKAYNLYSKTNSPYRTDAQSMMGVAYKAMKEKGDLKKFKKILEANDIQFDK